MAAPLYTDIVTLHDPRSNEFLNYDIPTLVNARISYSNQPRATTYYVSNSTGNDSNPGTEASPWKTIAKANSVLAALASTPTGGLAILFKCGDEWNETAGIENGTWTNHNLTNLTIGSYGTGDKPFFNDFSLKYTTGWTLVTGTTWQRAETNAIGWFRMTGKLPVATLTGQSLNQRWFGLPANLYPLINMASLADCEANVGSWFFDGSANLYCNLGSTTAPPDCEAVINNSHSGVNLFGDGVLIENIRADGWGRDTANGATQQMGITFSGAANATGWNMVAIGCEAYFCSTHCLAFYNGGTGYGGIATFAHCKGGYTVGDTTTGGATVINTYSQTGGQETIFFDFECVAGALPFTPASTVLQDYSDSNCNAFYGHTGAGYQHSLFIGYKIHIDTLQPYLPFNAAVADVPPTSGNILNSRVFLIELSNDVVATKLSWEGGAGWLTGGVLNDCVLINSDVSSIANPPTNNGFSTSAGGWMGYMINSVLSFTNTSSTVAHWINPNANAPYGAQNNILAWNCRFILNGNFNNWNPIYANNTGYTPTFINCDWVNLGGDISNSAFISAGTAPSSFTITNNCYSPLISWATGTNQQMTETYNSKLYIPEISSPLYQNGGVGSDGVRLQYDFYGNPRPFKLSIGPVEAVGAGTPTIQNESLGIGI